MKKLIEGLEVKEREVPAPQSYSEYVEDDGFFRDAEIGSIGQFIHSLRVSSRRTSTIACQTAISPVPFI